MHSKKKEPFLWELSYHMLFLVQLAVKSFIVSKSKSHRRIILEQMCAQLLLKGKSNNKKTKRN